MIDIAAVVARRRNALVAVDNTFATPANQRPLEHGADFVVHSTTKYLGGHSDVVGGVVVTRRSGLVRAPALRPERGRRRARDRSTASSSTAACAPCICGWTPTRAAPQAVVELLRATPGGADVRWPGFSGMVSFRHPRAAEIASATRLFTLAESLGGVESLIEVPQLMTHQSVEGSSAAVPPDLVRLSCGVEDPADLVADLRDALAALPVTA